MRECKWLQIVILQCCTAFLGAIQSAPLEGFVTAAEFKEQNRLIPQENGVRVLINAPKAFEKKTQRLILYATPNGSTIEQTFGSKDSTDWKMAIQQVGAQVRQLRSLDESTDWVLAIVEAPDLSWPAFRSKNANADTLIASLVDRLAKEYSKGPIILTGHSGGGALILGYVNSREQIPAAIGRIAFLDANYFFSDELKHGEKFSTWLKGDSTRALVTIAYDDREVVLNGKKVVGPGGGTFRATERMLKSLGREKFAQSKLGPFDCFFGFNGQARFYIHPNKENKILHTALVGEMNGVVKAVTVGTALESKWGKFGGPPSYASFIQEKPLSHQIPKTVILGKGPGRTLELPARKPDALTGAAFLEEIRNQSRQVREKAILREVIAGNVPGFLRDLVPIQVEEVLSTGEKIIGTYFAMPDYLAVGSDADFFRLPMSPAAAQAIASKTQCTLITTKISDDLHFTADGKVEPMPLTQERDAVATFYKHHQIIEGQLKGKPRPKLVAGIKKDIVWTNRLMEKPNRVALYGWHYPRGTPIQPLYVGHVDWYVDYSHGIRLVHEKMLVNGKEKSLGEIMKDPVLHGLLSKEGPLDRGKILQGSLWKLPE